MSEINMGDANFANLNVEGVPTNPSIIYDLDINVNSVSYPFYGTAPIEATIPAITGGVGVCHTYVDKDADVEMALNVVNNAKTQRPSVCNALDSLIVHSNIAPIYLPRMASKWAVEFWEARLLDALAKGSENLLSSATLLDDLK